MLAFPKMSRKDLLDLLDAQASKLAAHTLVPSCAHRKNLEGTLSASDVIEHLSFLPHI